MGFLFHHKHGDGQLGPGVRYDGRAAHVVTRPDGQIVADYYRNTLRHPLDQKFCPCLTTEDGHFYPVEQVVIQATDQCLSNIRSRSNYVSPTRRGRRRRQQQEAPPPGNPPPDVVDLTGEAQPTMAPPPANANARAVREVVVQVPANPPAV